MHPRWRWQRGGVHWSLIVLLAVVISIFMFQRWQQNSSTPIGAPTAGMPIVEPNVLALGTAGPIGIVDIAIQQPMDFDFKSRNEILQIRSAMIMHHPQLLAHSYKPTTEVFGQIVDGAPWWGIEGQFHRGPGQRSIEGASEESRFVLNPYLLVAAEFNDYWRNLTAEEAAHFPLYCPPQNLRWHAQQAYAEVTYAADCIAKRQAPQFDLIAFNARDLNLNYIYVSYADSKNIVKQNPPTAAYANPQFIHKGGSCGYPGGCNNMSPMTPPIDGIQLTGLPASIMIWLWKEQPSSVAQTPDMRFVIHFRDGDGR